MPKSTILGGRGKEQELQRNLDFSRTMPPNNKPHQQQKEKISEKVAYVLLYNVKIGAS